MSGLLDAVLLGAALSVVSGALAVLLIARFQRVFAGSETQIWRAARIVALLPLFMAPAIYSVPQYQDARIGSDAGYELAMPVLHADPGSELLRPDAAPSSGWPSAMALTIGLYLAGLTIAGGVAVRRHRWRRRLLRNSRPATPGERRVLERHANALGVWSPDMRVSCEAVSPFITGWKAVIVVPESLFANGDATRFALVHELTHLRRGDERDRLIGAAILAVFWFNWPLRRIERNLNQARELACDAECLDALGRAERKPYAAALIDMMRSAAQPVSAFGPDDRRHREMRIKAILAGKRTTGPIAIRLGIVAIAAILPVACAQAALTERTVVDVPVDLVTQVGSVDRRAGNRAVGGFGDRPVPARLAGNVRRNLQVDPAISVDPAPDAPRVRAPKPAAAPEVQVRAAPAVLATVAPEVSPRVDARVAVNNAVVSPDVDVSVLVSHDIAVTVPDFSHRVTDGRVTSHFGHRPSRPAGAPVRHGGTDIAAPQGTPVWSASAGRVIHAEMGIDGNDRWGNTVIVDHGDGWTTTYAHMHRIDVEVGQAIRAGHQIGTVGSTGASTGPHVHLEVRHNNERVDPATLVPDLR